MNLGVFNIAAGSFLLSLVASDFIGVSLSITFGLGLFNLFLGVAYRRRGE